MTNETFDQNSWEQRWARALRESPDKVASRSPNAHLLAEVGELHPGFALDAGCGHGAAAIWLAASGWRVTAVDFSATHSTSVDRRLVRPAPTSPSASSGSKVISAPGPRAIRRRA